MGFAKEFKEFAMRGNVMDMAVGVVIGAAFGKIVGSAVKDLIMPVVGQLTGGVDFSNKFVDLTGQGFATLKAAEEAGAATLNYGLFINNVLDFLIIALAIFVAIKAMNSLKRKEESKPADPTSKKCDECLMEIPIQAKRCGHCTAQLAPAA